MGWENSGLVDMGGQPGIPGARDRVALPLSALICGPDGAKTARKGGFFEVYHVDHIDVTPVST